MYHGSKNGDNNSDNDDYYEPPNSRDEDRNSDLVPNDGEEVPFSQIVRNNYGQHVRELTTSYDESREGSGTDRFMQRSQDGISEGGSDLLKNRIFPRALFDFVGVSGKDKTKMGVKMLKSKLLDDVPEDSKNVLLRVASNIVYKVMDTFLRSDGRGLLKAVMERTGLHRDEHGVLGRALSLSKTGCMEKRLLRCIAVGNLGREDATKLICDDVDYGRTLPYSEEANSSHRS